MKTSRQLALDHRQRQLLSDSDRLRQQLARQSTALKKPLAWLELVAELGLGWRALHRLRAAWIILRR